nr:hypothetical protein Iba_contig2837CG0010 [Ipomoea batatas]
MDRGDQLEETRRYTFKEIHPDCALFPEISTKSVGGLEADLEPMFCENCCCIGHTGIICRRRNGRPADVNDDRSVEVEEHDTPAVCLNAPVGEEDHVQSDAPIVEEAEQFRIGAETVNKTQNMNTDALNKDNGTSNMNSDAAMLYESMEAGSTIVKQGLEELACKGISIDHFVGDAVLEAAVNIIEEAAGNVMTEEVAGMEGEGSQKDDSQEEISSAGEEVSSQSISYNTWVEKLKQKVGRESGLLSLVEDARQEVESFFEGTLKELGRAGCEERAEELFHKANGIFLVKIAAMGLSVERSLSCALRGVRDKAESVQESGGSSKGEVRKRERVFKNTMDWVSMVEEYMKKDKLFEQKVKEALKEINAYLWTVYDKKKEEYVEEGRNRAMKAAAIFFVKVKQCPAWGSENGLLGRHLKANIDSVGARICHWAVTLDM